MNAVITGGTKGIGESIVDILASKGYNIVICARNPVEVSSKINSLSTQYPKQKFVGQSKDLSIKQEAIAFGEYAKAQLEVIDVLVNNAGMFIPGEILQEEDGMLDKMMDTNLYSAYHLTRVIAPFMKKNRKGHIFNMCSVASLRAYPNGGSYSISKFALLGFSKVLREELKPYDVKVTSIIPGATWSASWEGVDLPKTRLMESEDIAKMVFAAISLSPNSVVEDIIMRPQLGDL